MNGLCKTPIIPSQVSHRAHAGDASPFELNLHNLRDAPDRPLCSAHIQEDHLLVVMLLPR